MTTARKIARSYFRAEPSRRELLERDIKRELAASEREGMRRAAEIALIAEDVCAVNWWCMRYRVKRPDQAEQVRRAIEARLGRRPLVISGGES